jgi:hypothetical protein
MSIPGWKPPQRGPNGLVIGPLTGQMKPAALGVGGGLPLSLFVSAARMRAANAALAAWIACASLIAACSWACAARRASDLFDFAF